MIKAFIYILVLNFILISSVFADSEKIRISKIQALKTPYISLLNSYLDLMIEKKLIDQSDKRLEKRQLLVDDGGLCAFTAQVNALQATGRYYSIYSDVLEEKPDLFLDQVIEEAGHHMKEDPAYAGTGLYELKKYSLEVLKYYGLDPYITINYTEDMSRMNPDINFLPHYWKIRVLGMLSKNEKEGHTIVLLGVDKKNRLLFVSDPNYPNEVTEVPYTYTRNRLKVYLSSTDFPGFQPATIDEIIEVNVKR